MYLFKFCCKLFSNVMFLSLIETKKKQKVDKEIKKEIQISDELGPDKLSANLERFICFGHVEVSFIG